MNKKLILTTGCFHILHPGHVELLEYCSTLGSVVVGINDDNYLLQKSGKVYIPIRDRIFMLQSLKFVDYVAVFHEKNACGIIKKVKPDIFIKGPDYAGRNISEAEVCKTLGIEYIVAPQLKRYNTSDLIKLI